MDYKSCSGILEKNLFVIWRKSHKAFKNVYLSFKMRIISIKFPFSSVTTLTKIFSKLEIERNLNNTIWTFNLCNNVGLFEKLLSEKQFDFKSSSNECYLFMFLTGVFLKWCAYDECIEWSLKQEKKSSMLICVKICKRKSWNLLLDSIL